MEDKENYEKLKNATKELDNSINPTVKKELEDFTKLAKEINSEERSSIPEIYFKQYFLPYFQNLAMNKISKDDAKSDVLLKKWIEVAGGVYNEVDVIDTKGQTAFTVPAMCSRGTADIEKLRNINFYALITDYHRQVMRLPINKEQISYDKLSQIPKFLIPNSNSKDKQRWRDIFKRYSDEENKNKLPELKNNNTLKIQNEDLGLDID